MILLAAEASSTASTLTTFLPLLLVGAFVWFVMIRPQRKRQAAHKELINRLSVGSDVVTIGGVHGQVDALTEDYVDLLVTEDVVLRFSRRAVAEVVPDDADKDDDFDDFDDFDGMDELDDSDQGWPDSDDKA